MFKILIVEDEPFERFELKAAVSANYGEDQVRVADSIEDAIAVVASWKPDLILLDIRLKGHSGLEVARFVRKKQLRTEIIIITAYNDFEYAREAMSFGINYYLSKPVRPQVLMDKIQEALQKHKTRVRLQVPPIWPLLETNQEEKAQNQLGFAVATVLVAGFENGGDNLDEYVDYFTLELPSERCKVEAMEERIVAYLKDDYSELSQLFPQLAAGFANRFNQEVVLGLASSSPTLIEVYRRAIAACNHKIFYPQARILVYNQIERERENKWDYPVTMEQKLVNLVRRGEIGQIQELLRELVPTLVNLSDRSYLVLRTWVEGLVNSLKRMVISEGLLFNGITTPKPDSFWFSVAHLEKELSVWVKSIHTQFTVSIPTEQPLIAQAVNFMLEHYQEDLTLARVAQELKISPGYFSRLFKEEIGTPFKNYLITVRMDKAKQLLLQSTLAVSEVAFAVGYTDPNYFSEAFRKYEGVSPSEYKALNSRP